MNEDVTLEEALVAAQQSDNTREGRIQRMEAYVEWLLTPKAERDPKYKKDLAARLGITPATLQKYDHDPWVRKEYLKRSRVAFTVSRAADVIETLYTRATDPHDPQGVTAAKHLMQYMQAQDERDTEKPIDLASMTADELVNLAMEVAAQGAKKE